MVLDALDLVHAAVTPIPDPRRHLVRYHGADANRLRWRPRAAWEAARAPCTASGTSTGSVPGPAVGLCPAGPEEDAVLERGASGE